VANRRSKGLGDGLASFKAGTQLDPRDGNSYGLNYRGYENAAVNRHSILVVSNADGGVDAAERDPRR